MNPGDVMVPAAPVAASMPTVTSHESPADRQRSVMLALREEVRGVGQAEEDRLKKKDLWRSRISWLAGGIAAALVGWGAWKWYSRKK